MKPKKISLFYIGLDLYFIALFIGDIYGFETSPMIKVFKYISYFIFAMCLIRHIKLSRRSFVILLCTMSLLSLISLFTQDVYFEVIFVMILLSRKEEKEEILRHAYTLLFIGVLIVLGLTATGVLQNRITARRIGAQARYTLGFHHSNVLPLFVFYLFSWRLVTRQKLSYFETGLLIIFTVALNRICGSRSGFVLCVALILYTVYQNTANNSPYHVNRSQDGFISKLLYKYSLLGFALISVCLTFFYSKNPAKAYLLDFNLSGRLSLAYEQIRLTGIHLINLMPNSEYLENRIAVDNGYMFIIIRYGIIFMLFYIFVQFKIYNQHDSRLSFVFMLTSAGCLIDNDFLSCGFLPFILIAFSKSHSANNLPESGTSKSGKKIVRQGYTSFRMRDRSGNVYPTIYQIS